MTLAGLAAAAAETGKGGIAVGTVDGAGDIDAVSGVFLGAGVRGEDLDGVVDAGDGEEGFVGVAYWGRLSGWLNGDGEHGEGG